MNEKLPNWYIYLDKSVVVNYSRFRRKYDDGALRVSQCVGADDYTALHCMCEFTNSVSVSSCLRIIRELRDEFVQIVNVRTESKKLTALFLLFKNLNYHPDMFREIVYGLRADLSIVNRADETVLFYAARTNWFLDGLLEAGARVNVRSSVTGRTPLVEAVRSLNAYGVRELLLYGAFLPDEFPSVVAKNRSERVRLKRIRRLFLRCLACHVAARSTKLAPHMFSKWLSYF